MTIHYSHPPLVERFKELGYDVHSMNFETILKVKSDVE